jgi:hypothetical protein
MRYNYKKIFLVALILATILVVWARSADKTTAGKKFDLTQYHNVGNIWLRVSNYGFFGSGDDIQPQYPSLEYPGGSGADYLYQGALWFGAKKQRRDQAGNKLYWKSFPPTPENKETITEDHPDWNPNCKAVIDTLVSVGFDGDADLYEFLPAYNPLESGTDQVSPYFADNNPSDKIITASTRRNRRGVDDDGDGLIDEDFPGYTFKMRGSDELPSVFGDFSDSYLSDLTVEEVARITEGRNYEIWFPLGFMDLSDNGEDFINGSEELHYNFASPINDDGDNYVDEDGAPVSEQDFISYYYDYSPFGTSVNRDWGGARGGNNHVPLNIKVRQMSYQWSYEYIKNLVYVEFDVTNMGEDVLYDCAMGIYMDSDVGPQSYGSEKAQDDLSGYVKGRGYEFAYTRDDDGDDGLVTGLVGARVCTPDPDTLEFSCWYWAVGEGPDDSDPLQIGSSETYNEKYYLLTGKKPASSTDILDLRKNDDPNISEFEQINPADTRFLFAFYGEQPDGNGEVSDPTKRWNLEPGKTMKIVVAVFPGDNLADLKRSARWAKDIYGQAQDLTTVVLPDTFPHYNPPEPPEIPKMYAEIVKDGREIDVYWDNRSEYTIDTKTVSSALIGWQNGNLQLDSFVGNYDPSTFPPEFSTELANNQNVAGRLNPFTGYRLRHDFQGYTLWGRSGSGSQEDWELMNRWDKIETQTDLSDYVKNQDQGDSIYYGGYRGIDNGLPGLRIADETDTAYYRLNHNYQFVQIAVGDTVYGNPIYNPNVVYSDELQEDADDLARDLGSPTDFLSMEARIAQAMLFKNPNLSEKVFIELFDDALIPLRGHGGQTSNPAIFLGATDAMLEKLKMDRLSRRYYYQKIMYPPKGIEYYIAVTAFDRGIPSNDLDYLESGRDADANMKILFPGNLAKTNMDNIYVVPNPYLGSSKFDGRRESDDKGDKSKRLWFVNIPKRCTIRIYTLAGDLVDTVEHNGAHNADIITISKAAARGITADGMHEWDILSRYDQIIASGVYLYSVEDKESGNIKVGKFVIIK